jgi:hypothetical protein
VKYETVQGGEETVFGLVKGYSYFSLQMFRKNISVGVFIYLCVI